MGILTWIKIGALALALIVGFGGAWYVQSLRADNALLTRQIAGYKRAVEILKKDAQIDEATSHEKKLIDEINTLDELGRGFDRMRERARKGGNPKSFQAGD